MEKYFEKINSIMVNLQTRFGNLLILSQNPNPDLKELKQEIEKINLDIIQIYAIFFKIFKINYSSDFKKLNELILRPIDNLKMSTNKIANIETKIRYNIKNIDNIKEIIKNNQKLNLKKVA